MRDKRISCIRTVEEEIKWLNSLSLNTEEKIALLTFIIGSSLPEDKQIMQDTINALTIEKYLLGIE